MAVFNGKNVSLKIAADTTAEYEELNNKIETLNNKVDETIEKFTSVKVNTTLAASGWSSGVYTISNENITVTCVVELLPRENNGITQEQFEALAAAMIIGGTQAAGSIQLVALGDVPTIDIPITLIVRGDL